MAVPGAMALPPVSMMPVRSHPCNPTVKPRRASGSRQRKIVPGESRHAPVSAEDIARSTPDPDKQAEALTGSRRRLTALAMHALQHK
jgi:hypothetical protein